MRRVEAIFGPVSIVVLVLIAVAPAAASPSGTDRCRIAKLSAISAATAAGLRCWTQAIRQGRSGPDLECVLPPDGKLQRAFARAEKHGPCAPTALEAGLSIVAFVNAQGASVVPPPVATPTPGPTVSPTPSPGASATPPPGCGNGVVESGERCDGGPYCDAGCGFAFPSLCCDYLSLCIALADIPQADQCFLAGGTPRIGTTCVSPDPSCVAGQPCTGACEPTTFAATAFCCDAGDACTQQTLSDTESLASLLLQCGAAGVVEGTCVDGSCVPGG